MKVLPAATRQPQTRSRSNDAQMTAFSGRGLPLCGNLDLIKTDRWYRAEHFRHAVDGSK